MCRSLWGGIVVLALLAFRPSIRGRPGDGHARSSRLPIARSRSTSSAPPSPIRAKAPASPSRVQRFGKDKNDFSVRAGFADSDADDNTFLIGGDFRTQVVNYSESFPLDGSAHPRVRGIFGTDQEDVFLLPVGISLAGGRTSRGRTTAHPLRGPQHRAGSVPMTTA